jgi:hypothetical protein
MKRYSNIVAYPVVYLKNTNNEYVLDFNGEKIVLKNFTTVSPEELYDVVVEITNNFYSYETETINEIFTKRKTDLSRRYYMLIFLSPVLLTIDSSGYDGWGGLTKLLFNGTPALNFGDVQNYNGIRAYTFDANPSNLNDTPWHNIIYEHCHNYYKAGWRAFHFHFPYGNLTYSWLLDPIIQTETYTDSQNLAKSPARIKGFQQAIKALMDGTLNPGSPRIAMSESCDVHLYLTAANGYPQYREKSNAYWDSLPGTPQQKDEAYLQKLDQLVDYYVGMRSEKGILSVTLDVALLSATPNTLSLFRQLSPSDPQGYRSDIVELTDWYVAQKLIEAGIIVNCESRPYKKQNRVVIDSNTQTSPEETFYFSEWTNFTSDVSWFWYSNPELAAQNNDNGFIDYKLNEDVKYVHLIGGSNVNTGTRLPWGMSTQVRFNNNGTILTKEISSNTQNVPPFLVYTPYYAVSILYAAADMYLNYLYYSTGDVKWLNKSRNKTFSTFGIDPYLILGHASVQPGNAESTYAWWNNNGLTAPGVVFAPLFNQANFIANPATYSGGYWTGSIAGATGSLYYYTINVKGTDANSNETFLGVIDKLAKEYKPSGTDGPETSWGSDEFYLGIIDPIIRSP